MYIPDIFGIIAIIAGTAGIAWFLSRLFSKTGNQTKQQSAAQRVATITQINVYPIKSCGGISLQSATLGPFGFSHDRRWMIVNAEAKRFITQRQVPKLSLVQPAIISDGLLEVQAPGMEPLVLPYAGLAQEPIYEVGIWGDKCRAVDEGDAAAEWFSKYMGQEVRLVRTPSDLVRPVSEKHRVATEPSIAGWADGFPFLVISEASLDQLNTWLDESDSPPVPMKRFRPNVVVRGCPAFDEDQWYHSYVEHGSEKTNMYSVKKCSRCKLTTVIPEQGEFGGSEPLATVQKLHKGTFGQNLIHEGASVGRSLAVGDSFYLVSRKHLASGCTNGGRVSCRYKAHMCYS